MYSTEQTDEALAATQLRVAGLKAEVGNIRSRIGEVLGEAILDGQDVALAGDLAQLADAQGNLAAYEAAVEHLERKKWEAQVRRLLAKASRAAPRNGVRATKKRADTLGITNALFEACGGDLRGLRDRTLILFAFASGGRGRSEVAPPR